MVVGGFGFLGGAVVDELVRAGRDVVIYDVAGSQEAADERHGHGAVRYVPGDVRDFDAVMTTFRGAEEVYDFAGELGTSELDDNIPEAITTNVLGAAIQFEAAIRQGVPRVLYASKPNVWLNTYSITKWAAEQFAELYNQRGETRFSRPALLQRVRAEPEPVPDPQDHPDVRRPGDAGPAPRGVRRR